ncbi:unnamed protein product [Gongylonema pulchrum]|uniref:Uncharacterized protein n=1 Tax=Gongylonema pulchrum TaxID=637853 RepID=A0A183EYB4_9BILA|nr:unnamed protein product [Gongylonema pulchrum]
MDEKQTADFVVPAAIVDFQEKKQQHQSPQDIKERAIASALATSENASETDRSTCKFAFIVKMGIFPAETWSNRDI